MRPGGAYYLRSDDGTYHAITVSNTGALFIDGAAVATGGPGGGLTKAEADTYYAPIGSTGGSTAGKMEIKIAITLAQQDNIVLGTGWRVPFSQVQKNQKTRHRCSAITRSLFRRRAGR